MALMVGVVEDTSSKDVNTRYGKKQTFSIKVNGEWFSAGFKRPPVSAGDSVEIEYTTSKYGNEIADIVVVTGSAPPSAKSHPFPSKAPSGGKGVFPIPQNDGQRSIARQNALTQARELVVCSGAFGREDMFNDDGSPKSKEECTKALAQAVATIIEIAHQFEAYSTGDMNAEH